MLRIGKLTDYGMALICSFVKNSSDKPINAKTLSKELGLPLPTVSKVLKILSKAGLLYSNRGITGGYKLSRNPDEIYVGEVIEAFDGKISITDCGKKNCKREPICFLTETWKTLGEGIRKIFFKITINDLINKNVEKIENKK